MNDRTIGTPEQLRDPVFVPPLGRAIPLGIQEMSVRRIKNNVALTSVRACRQAMAAGELTSVGLVESCLARIEATDAELRAWIHLDAERALAQARDCDARFDRGLATGSLHGIPVGLKDILDTADAPTRRGSAIYAERRPDTDSAVVEKLREAGAVILGKTVTTEFAWRQESSTRNPHDLSRGPGGSSSGSAAAVAAGQVPLAVGSQTGGSTIRPASFCGIFGYKPTRGMVSRFGMLQTSQTLDHVGVFARHLGDLALFGDALSGFDRADAAIFNDPKPPLVAGYEKRLEAPPRLAWLNMPYAHSYSDDVKSGSDRLVAQLGGAVQRLDAPDWMAGLQQCHATIYAYEITRNLRDEYDHHHDLLSESAAQRLLAALDVTTAEYEAAQAARIRAEENCAVLFGEFDAILSPSSLGVAPRFGSGTGDPVCSSTWTLCGLPCIGLPLLHGEGGLPLGVQVIGAARRDDNLFETARWVTSTAGAAD